jgi:hypothetical protein
MSNEFSPEAPRSDGGADSSVADAGPFDASPAVDAFAGTFACGATTLDARQNTLLAAFEAHVVELGDFYSLSSNRNAVLGNNEPAYLDAMIDAWAATRNDKYLQRFVVHGDRVLTHRDDIAGYKNYRGLSRPTWSNGYYTGGQHASYLIEDGALVAALARFASLIKKTPCLAGVRDGKGRAFSSIADEYIRAASATTAFHLEEDWHTGSSLGSAYGYFTSPTDASFLVAEVPGRPVPLNYQSAIGRAFAYLYGATGSASYLDYAQRLGTYVLLEMASRYDARVDAYAWPGWPQMTYSPGVGMTQYPSPDDLSHSVISAEFALAMHEQGAGVFYSTELARLARTYASLVFRGRGSELALFLDGTGAAGSHEYSFGKVAGLVEFDPSLGPSIFDVMITRLAVDRADGLRGNDALTGLARIVRYGIGP